MAVARGSDVFLSPSIEPTSPVGRYVVAHELVHVAQQLRGLGHAPAATARLEHEANALASASGPASQVAAAPPGSTQKLDVLPPAIVEERLIPELTANRDAWKRYLDVPGVAAVLRTHDHIQHIYGDDPEFQHWMRDASYRPSSAPPPPAPVREAPTTSAPRARPEPQTGAPGDVVSGEGYYYESGEPVQGPVIITASPIEGHLTVQQPPTPRPQAKPQPKPRDWATEWNRMTPEQRVKAAYMERTTPRQRYEASLRGPAPRFIGEHERSLLEFEQTLEMIPGARAGVPLAQAILPSSWGGGEDILGRPVSRWEAAKRAATAFAEDVSMIFGPEDLMMGGGERAAALGGEVVEEGLMMTPKRLAPELEEGAAVLGREAEEIRALPSHEPSPVTLEEGAAVETYRPGEKVTMTELEHAPVSLEEGPPVETYQPGETVPKTEVEHGLIDPNAAPPDVLQGADVGTTGRAGEEYRMYKTAEVSHGLRVDFDPKMKVPRSVEYNLSREMYTGPALPERPSKFRLDPLIDPELQLRHGQFSTSGAVPVPQEFHLRITGPNGEPLLNVRVPNTPVAGAAAGGERGHLLAREAATAYPEALRDIDEMSNLAYMEGRGPLGVNRDAWRFYEGVMQDLATEHGWVNVRIDLIF
jgi:hypothetical protein